MPLDKQDYTSGLCSPSTHTHPEAQKTSETDALVEPTIQVHLRSLPERMDVLRKLLIDNLQDDLDFGSKVSQDGWDLIDEWQGMLYRMSYQLEKYKPRLDRKLDRDHRLRQYLSK